MKLLQAAERCASPRLSLSSRVPFGPHQLLSLKGRSYTVAKFDPGEMNAVCVDDGEISSGLRRRAAVAVVAKLNM